MLRPLILAFALLALAQFADAGLLGTQLDVQVKYQASVNSTPIAAGFKTTATVVDPGVEFPDLSKTQQTNPIGLIAPVSIDAGNDFLQFIILPTTGSGFFTPGYFNGYEFTFESSAQPTITGLQIDPARTTLGVTPADVTFSGNHLFLNVEGLPFRSGDTVRLDLVVQGGPPPAAPAPEPASLALIGTGVVGLLGYARRRAARA